jgi:hypothetical protein
MSLEKLSLFFLKKDDIQLTREELHECLRIMKENTEFKYSVPIQQQLAPVPIHGRISSIIKNNRLDQAAINRIFVGNQHDVRYSPMEQTAPPNITPDEMKFEFNIPPVSKYSNFLYADD